MLQNVDIPLLLGGPITLEIFPDQAASAKAIPAYTSKREQISTTSDAGSQLARQALQQWVTANSLHSLVQQLSTYENQAEAVQVIREMDLDADTLTTLWAAVGAKQQQTEYYRRALLLALWYLVTKGSCKDVVKQVPNRKPPPPGAGGSGEGHRVAVF